MAQSEHLRYYCRTCHHNFLPWRPNVSGKILCNLFFFSFINTVPQINGIPIAKSVSICYLVFTIIDILLLFLFYEIVLYTMKDFLNVNRYLALAWGILMIVLGILVIVIEIPLAKKNSEQVWKRMSTNE